jgi:hypothetical protein
VAGRRAVFVGMLAFGLLGLTLGYPRAARAITPQDVAVQVGLYDGVPIRSFGAYPFDINHDGWEDVFIVPHVMAGGRLYTNNQGSFARIAADAFPKRDRHGCAWSDVDLNSLPDMYCVLGTDAGNTSIKANELWMQRSQGQFVDLASQYGVTDPYGRGREAVFIDVNHDPYLDLYVTNVYPRKDGIPSPNRLYINEAGASFRAAPEFSLDQEVGGTGRICVQAVDFDADGWEDLLVCGKRALLLYRNMHGSGFTNVGSGLGIASGSWLDAQLVDLNGDVSLDLVGVKTATSLQIQLQVGGRFGSPRTIRTSSGFEDLATGDVNRDGRPDIYVVRRAIDGVNLPDLLLINSGDGTGYTELSIPQATSGDGQSVAALDYNNNGATDFIVLNGRARARGPIQLISLP